METTPKIKIEIMQPNNEKHMHQIYADGWVVGNVWDTVDRIKEMDGKYYVFFTGLTVIYADEIEYVDYNELVKKLAEVNK